MLKKLFALLLCLVLALSFVACDTDPVDPTTDSDADASTSSDDASEEKAEYLLFDPDMDHKFLANDIKKGSVVLFDLDECEMSWDELPTLDSCVAWEWVARECKTCKYWVNIQTGIDDAKYRYSEYYKKDVIIACSSGGWAGIIDFETKEILFEALVPNGPHSIELLPNGDLVVASSGGDSWATAGYLRYFPLSTGSTTHSDDLKVPSAHGVQWDPVQEVLWALQYDGVIAVQIRNYGTKNAKMMKLSDMGATFNSKDASGHDLSPVYGQPGKYWVTAGRVWIFDSETNTLTENYKHRSGYNASGVKGIAYFPDGTMVSTPSGIKGAMFDWSTPQMRLVYLEMSPRVQQVIVRTKTIKFTDREFYKVHTFCKDYQ